MVKNILIFAAGIASLPLLLFTYHFCHIWFDESEQAL
jgi:hypothetical protein